MLGHFISTWSLEKRGDNWAVLWSILMSATFQCHPYKQWHLFSWTFSLTYLLYLSVSSCIILRGPEIFHLVCLTHPSLNRYVFPLWLKADCHWFHSLISIIAPSYTYKLWRSLPEIYNPQYYFDNNENTDPSFNYSNREACLSRGATDSLYCQWGVLCQPVAITFIAWDVP